MESMRLLSVLIYAIYFIGAQSRSVVSPDHPPEMWKLQTSESHVSREEWLRCHGMPCDAHDRTVRKVALIKLSAAGGGDDDQGPQAILDEQMMGDDSLDRCIWLNEEQADMMLEDMEAHNISSGHVEGNHGNVADDEKIHRVKRAITDFNSHFYYKWPADKPIAWKFDGAHDVVERAQIRRGFTEWQQHTCLRFQELPTNQAMNDNHILITRMAGGCHSYIGRQSFWPQQLNLMSGCSREIGVTIHEIGHALGLWHEQQRPDRDSIIKINLENVSRWLKGQFNVVNSIATFDVPYDTTSVMHYRHMDGTINGKSTIETRNPLYQYNMGQRTGLSYADIKVMNRAYCSDACSPQQLSSPCAHGGHQDPNNCYRCKCPDGYGGLYCEHAAYQVKAVCGGDVTLKPGEERTITSPGYDTVGYYDNFQECAWVFKTSGDAKLRVEFVDEFSLYCHHQDVCYHWVEVKYLANQELAGPRFCCSKKPYKLLMSEGSEMAVVFKSPWKSTDLVSRRGFKAVIKAVSIARAVPTSPRTTTTATSTRTTTISVDETLKPTQATTMAPMFKPNPADCVKMDLIFILDSSGSVMEENWKKMLIFVQTIINQLNIGISDTRVGVVSFGNRAEVEIGLKDYDENERLQSAISDIEWKDEWTNTPDALIKAKNEFLQTTREAHNVAVLITDGKANVDAETVAMAAGELRDEGVEVMAMPVGGRADREEATTIAGSSSRVIPVDSFTSLLQKNYDNIIISKICEIAETEPVDHFSWSCDFEGDDGGGFCGMMQENRKDEFNWSHGSGSTPSDNTGPTSASQGMFYMYIEASDPRNLGDRAIIKLPKHDEMGMVCLMFDYNMYGHHIGALKVIKVNADSSYGDDAWVMSGEQGESWTTAAVQTEISKDETIAFLGVRGTEYSGDIAVDKIIVFSGSCLT